MLLSMGRGLKLACPRCGGGPLLASWFKMQERCPKCKLVLEREEGYFLGAIGINMFVAEGLFGLILAATMFATWPNPPWLAIWAMSVVGVVVGPILFFPFSKTLWLAMDYGLFGER